ncbi:hypothetical protein OKW32_003577 [Paraburkholderia youngii]
MPRSKIPTPATEQDLKWFEPDNYEGLGKFAVLDWARLVGDRLNNRRAFDCGNPEAVAGGFETLKKPLTWLGYRERWSAL